MIWRNQVPTERQQIENLCLSIARLSSMHTRIKRCRVIFQLKPLIRAEVRRPIVHNPVSSPKRHHKPCQLGRSNYYGAPTVDFFNWHMTLIWNRCKKRINYGYQFRLERFHGSPSCIEKRPNYRPWPTFRDRDLSAGYWESNDGTLLKSFGRNHLQLIGMDPTGNKFRDLYPKNVQLVSDFFSYERFRSIAGSAKRKS